MTRSTASNSLMSKGRAFHSEGARTTKAQAHLSMAKKFLNGPKQTACIIGGQQFQKLSLDSTAGQ